MKSLFKCELHYVPSLHLNQIYEGFEKLQKIGIVDLRLKHKKGLENKPILKVVIDDKYEVIYDTLDGFNWIDGSIEENLCHFKNNIKVDFYFKRSYNNILRDYTPENCQLYPLGLNYTMIPTGKYPKNFKESLFGFLKNNALIKNFYNNSLFPSKDFEYYPIPNKEHKILFLTRLWNPDEVKYDNLKDQREELNKNRIDCIMACRKEFGDKFIGGLQNDNFSARVSKELIVPFSLTKKQVFLNHIKESNICIGTTGLHNSIGWKFAEYVAASRAIVTEPLVYDLPGVFKNKKNYLMFENKYDLIENIYELLKSEEKLFNMMRNNYQYYHNYLRPDSIVLNTLLKIRENYNL